MNGKILYTLTKENTVCIHRMYGQTSEVVVPSLVDGKIVTEIGDYCFSKTQKIPSDILVWGLDDVSFGLQASDFVQSVSLPDTIQKIGSYAFYNCRKLKRISFDGNIDEIGSDLFLNCLKLHSIEFQCDYCECSILKYILKQISWDIEIKINEIVLLFPEYYENYNVIGPAHIFGMNISGEGFRARQCFVNNQFQIIEYDSVFEKLCIEENDKTLVKFALNRLLYPVELNEIYKKEYEEFIRKHPYLSASSILMKDIDSQLKIQQLEIMIHEKYIDEDTMNQLITMTSNQDMSEITTYLIQWKRQYFFKKKTYDFEDF